MTKHCACDRPYLSKHTSYDSVFCCTKLKWWHLKMLFSVFQNVGFLGWQKILSYSISQELFLIWLWCLVHMCKMMISPAIFYFFRSLFFLGGGGQSLSINVKMKFWGVAHLVCDFFIFFSSLVTFFLFSSLVYFAFCSCVIFILETKNTYSDTHFTMWVGKW